jgi:hypothetical protein
LSCASLTEDGQGEDQVLASWKEGKRERKVGNENERGRERRKACFVLAGEGARFPSSDIFPERQVPLLPWTN